MFHRNVPTLAVLSVLTFLAPLQASAQTSDEDDLALTFGDKDTVSLATGNKQSTRHAPAVTTIITAQDIAAMGATDLDEVLEAVPGLHVTRAPSMGAPIYAMRGVIAVNGPQVLMLQNGLPVTVAISSNKGNLWGGLPLKNIARIEIIRGPGSALYGADAFTGVINLITKMAEDIGGTEAGIRTGSFNTQAAWLQHGSRIGGIGGIDIAASLQLGRTDGHKETLRADSQSTRDQRSGTHVSLAPGQINAAYDTLDASLDLAYGLWRWRTGYKLRDHMETYAGVGSALDPVGRGRSERITSDISWSQPQLSANWSANANLSFMSYQQRFPVVPQLSPPGTRFPTGTFTNGMFGAPEFSERSLRLSASTTYSGFVGHTLRLGLGHDDLNLYETGTFSNFNYSAAGVPIPSGGPIIQSPTPFNTPHRRRVDYLYAQDEWNFARDWTLTAGMRHDRYSDFGATTNPRLALVWDARSDLTAKLLYGTAFRAPSFAEQYNTNNPIGRGNPNIQPEQMTTIEAVMAWRPTKDLAANLNLFHYQMKDIIRTLTNPAPALGTTYNNTSGQYGDGGEMELVWDAHRNLRLTAHYAYQRSIDEASQQDAGLAPRQHTYARADWRFAPNGQINGQINRVVDRRRAAGDTRPAVPNATTVDVTLRTGNGTPIGKTGWELVFSIRNLLNAGVREPTTAPLPDDLPLAKRSAWAEVRLGL